MSYDIRFKDATTGETVILSETHSLRGGTYILGGTREAWLNITYNYAPHYCRVLDQDKGIRSLYGKTGAEAVPLLEAAIGKLGTDESDDYWEATEGNARAALVNLLTLARACPEGVIDGD
jgi:hypothetical protein